MEYTSYHDLNGLKIGVVTLLHENAPRPRLLRLASFNILFDMRADSLLQRYY